MSTHDQINPPHTTNDYPHQVRAFQAHAGVFAATMMLIFAVNLSVNLSAGIAGQWSTWWSVWALIGWSLGIAVHGLVVFLAKPANGSQSHQRNLRYHPEMALYGRSEMTDHGMGIQR